jgi:hypothetical protein
MSSNHSEKEGENEEENLYLYFHFMVLSFINRRKSFEGRDINKQNVKWDEYNFLIVVGKMWFFV